jgi:hypothetical protein
MNARLNKNVLARCCVESKAVSGGFLLLFMGPSNFSETTEKEQNPHSDLTSCANLQASNGSGNTHTHAWLHICISEIGKANQEAFQLTSQRIGL